MVEKHHCRQCNTWIQGDRISIRNHEASQRHKERVTANATHRAAEKEKADRNESERLMELEEVERNARARFAMDMRGRSTAVASDRYDVPIGAGPVLLPPQHEEDDDDIPPPPPPRRHKMTPPPPPPRPQHYAQQHQQHHHTYQAAAEAAPRPVVDVYYPPPAGPPPPPSLPPPSIPSNARHPLPPSSPPHSVYPPHHPQPPPPAMNPPQSLPPSHVEPSIEGVEKSKGFYTVRGVVYLEGQAHESKLTKAKPCEVWIEDEESWVPVTITRIFTTTVHDTNEKFKHYHVQRQDDPAAPPIEDVRSDALRIPLNLPVGMIVPTEPDQTADFLHRVQQVVAGDSSCRVSEPVAAKSAPDYGGWATVSVRVVDEAAEEAAIEADAKAFQAQTTAIQVERDNELLMEESLHADNAMGAFNPWGGRYKGIALDETSKNDPEEDNEGGRGKANHVVAFHVKKGKRANGKRRVADDA